MYNFKSRKVPFDTPLADPILGCATLSAARFGFDLGGRNRVRNDMVYRIFETTQSAVRSPRSSPRRTQNELRALGHDDIRGPQMLVHLHPTKQEASVQVEIHAAQRVQFEVTIDRANLVFRQPEKP